MKCATEREPDFALPVPAQVDDEALRREEVKRLLKPCRGRARVHYEIASALGIRGQREVDAEGGRDLCPSAVHVDERDLRRREASEQACDAAAHHSRADHRDPITEQRHGVP